MPQFLCRDRFGQERVFRYESQTDPSGTVDFQVYSVPPPMSGDFFECSFTPLNPTTVRQTMIDHHGHPNYAGMGIPDSLLPIAAAKIGKTIVSSPGLAPGGGVWRTPFATKMWNRLVAKQLATYDPVADVFRLL